MGSLDFYSELFKTFLFYKNTNLGYQIFSLEISPNHKPILQKSQPPLIGKLEQNIQSISPLTDLTVLPTPQNLRRKEILSFQDSTNSIESLYKRWNTFHGRGILPILSLTDLKQESKNKHPRLQLHTINLIQLENERLKQKNLKQNKHPQFDIFANFILGRYIPQGNIKDKQIFEELIAYPSNDPGYIGRRKR